MSVFTAVNVNEEDPELKEKIVVKEEYEEQDPLKGEGKLSLSIYLSFNFSLSLLYIMYIYHVYSF